MNKNKKFARSEVMCGKCGYKVSKTKVKGYKYFCPNCFEDLYIFEVMVSQKNNFRFRSIKK